MPSEQLEQLLALPLAERIDLARALWESVLQGEDSNLVDAQGAVDLAWKRDSELTSGAVAGRSHQEVMESARRALRCD